MALATKVADYFPSRLSVYCPRMQYQSSMNQGQAAAFSLGTPAAADNDIIDTDVDADAVAGTLTTQTWVSDSPYGRTLSMNANADPGANGVVDLRGTDYLGQPMVERFSFATGVTPVMYGKKAFYRLTSAKIVTPCVNATTYDIGTGLRLGLPFRPVKIDWVKENGVLVAVRQGVVTVGLTVDDADAAAGGSFFVRSPVAGYVETLRAWTNTAGSTNDPVITVELANVAITGLTVTINADGTVGTVVSDTPTTAGYNANNRLIAGDQIEFVATAAAGANSYNLEVDIANGQFTLPDNTDPGTATTGDPRGTFEATAVFDGVKEYIVGLVGDPSINASFNGGYHGIRHYYA